MSITKLTNSGLSGDKYPNLMADNTFMEPIATTLVGSGGSSAVTFSNIPQIYRHLQVRCFWKLSAATNLTAQFNGDTGSNYKAHELYGDGASASSFVPSVSPTAIALGYNGSSTSFGVTILDILDYTNQNKYKTSRALFGDDRNGAGDVSLDSGLWMNTSAITKIDIKAQGSNTISQYSRFSLYGIRG